MDGEGRPRYKLRHDACVDPIDEVVEDHFDPQQPPTEYKTSADYARAVKARYLCERCGKPTDTGKSTETGIRYRRLTGGF